jgi:hypothetical protein
MRAAGATYEAIAEEHDTDRRRVQHIVSFYQSRINSALRVEWRPVRNPYAEGLWHHFGPQEKYLGSTQEPCGERTKANGKKLGSPVLQPGDAEATRIAREAKSAQATVRAQEKIPYIDAARAAGAIKLREICEKLMAWGVPSPSGSPRWHPATVQHVELMAGVPVQPTKPLYVPVVPNPAERQWWTSTGSAD